MRQQEVTITILSDDEVKKKKKKPHQLKRVRRRKDDGKRRLVKGQWDFFDLCTRLQNVDVPANWLGGRASNDHSAISDDPTKTLQYVEILLSANASMSKLPSIGVPNGERDVYSLDDEHVFIEYDTYYRGADHTIITPNNLADVAQFDSIILGTGDAVDPFKTTKLKGDSTHKGPRDIPNCMPLKFENVTDPFTLTAYDEDGSVDFVNNPFSLERWQGLDERLDWEKWNPLCVAEGSTQIFKRGQIDIKKKDTFPILRTKNIQLKFKSDLVYESFDTGDKVNYKITVEPNFLAKETALTIKNTTPLKFYLKPQWMGIFRTKKYSVDAIVTSYEVGRQGWPDFGHPTTVTDVSLFNFSFLFFGITFDPLINYGSGTATLTINPSTGHWSFSGLPNGLSGSGIATLTGSGPSVWDTAPGTGNSGWPDGFRLQFVQSAASNVDVTATADYGIGWQLYSRFNISNPLNLSAGFFGFYSVGAHIGRRPVFFKVINSSIYAVANVNGFSNFTHTYYNGVTKNYDASVALAFQGTQEKIFSSIPNDSAGNNSNASVYKRAVNRDGSLLVTRMRTYNFVYQANFLTTRNMAPTSHPNIGDISTKSSFELSLTTYSSNIKNQIQTTLAAEPNIRNVIFDSSDGVNIQENIYYMNQIDVKVGALCAVIVKNGVKYYIWRKTDEVRTGYSYDHKSIAVSYNQSIDS